jgi:Type I phosphodiesterase / nucleotide pyrophosphatase
MDEDMVARIWRGYDPARSEDVVLVPAAPNYIGEPTIPSHTGPWDYVQEVPLVVYGPPYVRAGGTPIGVGANLTDIYPTVGRLAGVTLPERAGKALSSALVRDPSGVPPLIAVVSWDGVGRNVLERWPDRWPTLAKLEERGTSYAHATVGSSPSITPAAHSTMGTGAWPRSHGVTAIKLRGPDGRVTESFAGNNPEGLKLSTFADEIDLAFDNRSKVGLIAWQSWHLGLLGHGLATLGGDADTAGIISPTGEIGGNASAFSTPAYLSTSRPGLEARAAELDARDGRLDQRWLGHDILEGHQSPAWAAYETDVILRMLRRGHYGRDRIPDLLLANYKMTDIAGHQFTMDSAEMADDLEAQDAALARLLAYLDEEVGDYVVIVTADHGHTPSPERTGAWAISLDELIEDLDAHFGVTDGRSLVQDGHAAGLFLDAAVGRAHDVSAAEVAAWLEGYTVHENARGDLPAGFEERASEQVFEAVFRASDVPRIVRCRFGSVRPLPHSTA